MKKLALAAMAAGSLLAFSAGKPAAPKTDAAEVPFSAGYYRIDVTPPLGVPLSGYYSRRAMTGILDPLYATCLALSDGKSKAVVVALDNLQVYETVIAQMKEAIKAKTGLPPEAVFIHASHIHTGPTVVAKGVCVKEGGYEAATSRFAPGTAERLVNGQLEQLKSLYGQAAK